MYTLIAAYGHNGVIGKGNDLPWKLSSDLKHFKAVTTGGIVVMGRKTFESIGNKPLPNRFNIVISSSLTPSASLEENYWFCRSVEEFLDFAEGTGPEIFVIGGQTIYEQTIDKANRLLITQIDHAFDGDRFFPIIDLGQWECVSEIECDTDTYPYRICDYRRIKESEI